VVKAHPLDALLARIGTESFPPIVLFCDGKAPFQKEPFEPYLVEEALQKILTYYAPTDERDMILAAFHADETDPGTIAEEAQTLPLLVPRRVVLVRRCERFNTMSATGALRPLLEYLERPSETSLLLMVSAKADRSKPFYKACAKSAEIVECPQLTDEQLRHWVKERLKLQKKRIEPEAVEELLRRSGSRLSDVANAVELAATFVGANDVITEQDVLQACADVAEETIWALTDAIAQADADHALETLYQLMDMGKSSDEILGILQWLLETAYKVATHCMPVTPFLARKVKPLVDRFASGTTDPVVRLRAAMTAVTDAHFALRESGAADERMVLEILVLRFVLAGKRVRRAAS
jgi:DNA polymerase III delta subunit